MLKGGDGGRARASGGIVFEHEQPLQFSRKFLSILISTNKVGSGSDSLGLSLFCNILFSMFRSYSTPSTLLGSGC